MQRLEEMTKELTEIYHKSVAFELYNEETCTQATMDLADYLKDMLDRNIISGFGFNSTFEENKSIQIDVTLWGPNDTSEKITFSSSSASACDILS